MNYEKDRPSSFSLTAENAEERREMLEIVDHALDAVLHLHNIFRCSPTFDNFHLCAPLRPLR
jgi:hypothetical protein